MRLEEVRLNKKTGEDDPSLEQDLRNARQNLVGKQNDMVSALQSSWNQWDTLVDRAASGTRIGDEDRDAAINRMLSIVNRRNYLRNLLREIDEVLER